MRANATIATIAAGTSSGNEKKRCNTYGKAANTAAPRGSPVKVQLGVQVLGATETNSQQAAAPGLARTGGLFLAGLSLWLLLGGVLARLAGSQRLWRLARRRG